MPFLLRPFFLGSPYFQMALEILPLAISSVFAIWSKSCIHQGCSPLRRRPDILVQLKITCHVYISFFKFTDLECSSSILCSTCGPMAAAYLPIAPRLIVLLFVSFFQCCECYCANRSPLRLANKLEHITASSSWPARIRRLTTKAHGDKSHLHSSTRKLLGPYIVGLSLTVLDHTQSTQPCQNIDVRR